MKHKRLQSVFSRALVFALPHSGLTKIKLKIGCAWINKERKTPGLAGRRAYMHVGDLPSTVCCHPGACKLSDSHLIGLFLHELGHLATGGNDPTADAWVFTALGVPLEYRGGLMLEWVDPEIIKEKRI